MKNFFLILTLLFIGTQLLTSCSSGNKITNQFAKRKYLKKHKGNIRIAEEYRSKVNYDTSSPMDLPCFEMQEIEEIDLTEMPELISPNLTAIEKLDFLSKEDFIIEPEPVKYVYIANNYVEDEEEKEALEKKAKGSFILGILGIPLSFTLFAPLLAIVTGVKVLRRIRMNLSDDNKKNRTRANIGVVLGIIGLLLFHVILITHLNTIAV